MRGVIFDVNHTLIGIRREGEVQSAAVAVLYNQAVSRSRKPFREEDFREVYACSWREAKGTSYELLREVRYEDIVSRVLIEFDIFLDDASLEEMLQAYMEPLYEASFVIPGVREMLGKLRGYCKIGAVTNYKYASGMREMLRRLDLLGELDSLVISSEFGWVKPATEIYSCVLAALGASAKECIIIGNELEKDLWQARKMGMTTVLLSLAEMGEGYDSDVAAFLRERISIDELQCDYVVSSMADLSRLIVSLLMGNR